MYFIEERKVSTTGSTHPSKKLVFKSISYVKERQMDLTIDRTGFETLHIYDWPLVRYNDIKQDISMTEDEPRRQDYCPWCRGFGSASYFQPDPCAGCRGTGVVFPRQQVFLMDRFYSRLNNDVYPDWPRWTASGVPVFPTKPGQWNDYDTVMSYRARMVEIKFDEERKKKFPEIRPRVTYPTPKVEELIKVLKVPRYYFPNKPHEEVHAPAVKPRSIVPDFNPMRYRVTSREEIERLHLRLFHYAPKVPKKLERPSSDTPREKVEPYSPTPKLERKFMKTNSSSSDTSSEKNFFALPTIFTKEEMNKCTQLCFPEEKNSDFNFLPPLPPDPTQENADTSENSSSEAEKAEDEASESLEELEMKKLRIEVALKEARKLRQEKSMELCDENLSRKDLLLKEGDFMKCHEKIMALENELEALEESFGKMKTAELEVIEVKPFQGLKVALDGINREIEFEQKRHFYAMPTGKADEWQVTCKSISMNSPTCRLTQEEYFLGMTLAQDQVFSAPSDSPQIFKIKMED